MRKCYGALWKFFLPSPVMKPHGKINHNNSPEFHNALSRLRGTGRSFNTALLHSPASRCRHHHPNGRHLDPSEEPFGATGSTPGPSARPPRLSRPSSRPGSAPSRWRARRAEGRRCPPPWRRRAAAAAPAGPGRAMAVLGQGQGQPALLVKVVMAGESCVGKTSIVRSYTEPGAPACSSSSYLATIGECPPARLLKRSQRCRRQQLALVDPGDLGFCPHAASPTTPQKQGARRHPLPPWSRLTEPGGQQSWPSSFCKWSSARRLACGCSGFAFYRNFTGPLSRKFLFLKKSSCPYFIFLIHFLRSLIES